MKSAAACILFVIAIVFQWSCSHNANTLFNIVDPSKSKVQFANNIEENVDFNILTYEYLYNGGGVAVGDLNNDQLPDIVFSGNMVNSKIYLNKGDLVFEDITDATGFKDRERWKTGVVLADVNGDGMLDIYLCYSGPGTDDARSNQLFVNKGVTNGKPQFAEAAKEFGVDAPGTYSTTASFFDMDNDGDLDMFLVNHADMFFNPFFNTDKLRAKRHPKFGNRLYRNDDNKFVDISSEAMIDGSGLNFGLSVSTSDINNDGWTDVYVTNDYDERDFLYLNNHNGTFREVLNVAAGHLSEFAMGSDIADFNNDELTDVMVLDMLPEDNHRQKLLKGADTYDKYTTRVKHGFHNQQMRNTLQLNNGVDSAGIPVFSEVGQMAGVQKTDWSWAPLFADFDNDGWKDLFISNGIFKDITNLDFVKYTSGYSKKYEEKQGDKMEMWELIKKMPSTKLKNYFFRNTGDMGFENMSATWGTEKETISNGSAYSDLDNDGDLDLVVNCLNDDAMILENKSIRTSSSNYLKLRLVGKGKNAYGIGAKVLISSASGKQVYEQFTSRGFQSSIDPIIHVGTGKDSIIESIEVRWTTGSRSILKNVKANRLITVNESEASVSPVDSVRNTDPLFTNISLASGINFTQKQSPFVDFKVTPLLPFQQSKLGVVTAVADVNNDGLDDVFFGTNTKNENKLFLQTATGSFQPASANVFNDKKDKTIADALFIDVDGDGDKDLYLVSGGADYYRNARNYQDELYVNDGRGNFTKKPNALPEEMLSGSCIAAADYNKDGKIDLFIGSQVSYGEFPVAPRSMLLTNRSVGGNVRFDKDEQQKDTSLYTSGMITDAEWVDLNSDGWMDLVVVGLFMPVTIFENDQGQLVNRTKEYALDNTKGWFCKILADDFNGDGKTDLVIGNMGKNSTFRASRQQPLTITFADFNNDQVIDPILSFYNGEKSYPYFSRDEMFDQMPVLQKKFPRYADYADAQLHDLFSQEQLDKAKTISIDTLSSFVLINNGDRKLMKTPLPSDAQLSMASGMVAYDVDGDSHNDIVMAGNFFPMRAQLGPMDASIGVVLKNDGKGNFTAMRYKQTGLLLKGDIRALHKVSTKMNDLLVTSPADGPVQVVKINKLKT